MNHGSREWRAATGSAMEGRHVQATSVLASSRVRLRWLRMFVLLFASAIMSRVVALEYWYGAAFRQEGASAPAAQPASVVPRGRILARDGTVLARDQSSANLEILYRYLQRPLDERWLSRQARSRLEPSARRNPQRVAIEKSRLRVECDDLLRRLAELCDLSPTTLRERCQAIQVRVERMSASVQARRAAREADANQIPTTWREWLEEFFRSTEEPPAPLVLAEELQYYALCRDVSPAVLDEIACHPERYPGIRVVPSQQRVYARHELAAHVVGYVGVPPAADDAVDAPGNDAGPWVGMAGVEKLHDERLRASSARRNDRTGVIQPWDLVLCLDVALQASATSLLKDACARRRHARGDVQAAPSSGAILVMDAFGGEILASVSAPGFDPNHVASADHSRFSGYLNDPGQPFFDRATQSTLAPGPALACLGVLLGIQNAPPPESLQDANSDPCDEASLRSLAARLGSRELAAWSRRCGWGETTGLDLPGEHAGYLPPVGTRGDEPSARASSLALAYALGKEPLLATPVQIVRWLAAIANGGTLVQPRLLRGKRAGATETLDASLATAQSLPIARGTRIAGVHASTWERLREALAQATLLGRDPVLRDLDSGEATFVGLTHGLARPGAGAQVWCACYTPRESPRVVFFVLLENIAFARETLTGLVTRLATQTYRLGHATSPRAARQASRKPAKRDAK